MTLEEIKDLILFCKEHGVSQIKVGETAFVIETPVPEINLEQSFSSPFGG